MKILLTGPRGFVGSRILSKYPDMIPSPSLRGLNEEQVRRIVEESEADVVIHTAAMSNIQSCAENPEESYQANVMLPVYLARACRGRVSGDGACSDRKLICFSSDQVYSGLVTGGPYTEDIVKPGNLYASEKIEMENRVLDILPDSVMLRAEWMYDYPAPKGNYVTNTIAALQNHEPLIYSSTQLRGVTYMREVVDAMENVIKLPGGAYNFGSETDVDMYEVTRRFCDALGVQADIIDGHREGNLWMDCSKARQGGVIFSDIVGGLLRCADDHQLKTLLRR